MRRFHAGAHASTASDRSSSIRWRTNCLAKASACASRTILCASLQALVQRPGELVTREELIAALWPPGTFVDSEHGLNTAVRKLRQALGPQHSRPAPLETVPRRGYRLTLPVEALRAHDRASLAVLPLEDLSPERDQTHLCEGLADELVRALGPVPGLHIAQRRATYSAPREEPARSGLQLGVRHVLAGSLRRDGERLRIDFRLLESATGRELWSGRFDPEGRPLLCVPISRAIARAWLALLLASQGRFDDAIATARRGHAIDPGEPPTATYLGWTFFFARRFDDAFAVFEPAPEFAIAWIVRAWIHEARGRWEDALAALDEAVASNETRWARRERVRVLAAMGRETEALETYEAIVESGALFPAFERGLLALARGDRAAALDEFALADSERCPWMRFARVDPRLDGLRGDLTRTLSSRLKPRRRTTPAGASRPARR